MNQRIEREAALMRDRSRILPGSGGSRRRGKQVWTSEQLKLKREIKTMQQKQNRELLRRIKAKKFGDEIGNDLVTHGKLHPSCNVQQSVQTVNLAAEER